MTIATLHRVFSRTILLLGFTALVACGGGGGGGDNTTASPSSTSITDISSSSVSLSSTDAVGVSSSVGINSSVGESSIPGQSSSLASESSSNQTLSSQSSSSIGGGIISSSASSVPPLDITPNAFVFPQKTDVEPSALITSSTVIISGIDAPVAVGISGGEYSINGGAFTAVAGTIGNNQTLAIRLVAADTYSTTTSAMVTVGGVSASFNATTKADTTPEAFGFESVTDAELDTVYTSGVATITGIDSTVSIHIESGEYSIDGAAFTAIDGRVSNGQTLAVRLTASAVHSTATSATVTVGGVSASFSVTTKADTTPEAFSFEPVIDAELDTVYTSGAITVTGIDAAVPITVTGGEYAINSEEIFTSAAGTVSANNTVRLRGTSAPGNNLTHAVVVTIGGVSATYSITTIPDTTPPVAEFKFPTPYTMSEADTVKVRGTATDDNTITSVKVVVRSFKLDTPDQTIASTEFEVTPKAEIDGVKDFSSWTADIPLTALAENEIKVIATDENDNTIPNEDANKVTIRQADVLSAFPDEVNQFDYAVSLVFDTYDGRNRVLVASSYGGDQNVIAVDLATGRRSIAFTSPDCSLFGLTIDPLSKHIFGACSGNLYEFNLSDGSLIGTYRVEGSVTTIPAIVLDRNNGRNRLVLLERRESEASGKIISFALDTKIFSTISAVDQLPSFQVSESILSDGDNYLVPGSDLNSDFGGQIISVSALDGTRKILSDNTIGTGDLYGGVGFRDMPVLSTMVKDPNANKFFVFEYWSSRIFTLDQETMNRKIFSDISFNQQGIVRNEVGSIDMDTDGVKGHLYIADERRKSIIIVDTETGAKVILSKSKNNR